MPDRSGRHVGPGAAATSTTAVNGVLNIGYELVDHPVVKILGIGVKVELVGRWRTFVREKAGEKALAVVGKLLLFLFVQMKLEDAELQRPIGQVRQLARAVCHSTLSLLRAVRRP